VRNTSTATAYAIKNPAMREVQVIKYPSAAAFLATAL
jgi:hypothetical protein